MDIKTSNSRFLNMMQRNKHTQHAMKNNKAWWRDRLKHEFGFDVWKLPVCERCEGYALWHKDGVGACRCGHITKKPITVEQYYEQGHHVDRTLNKDSPGILDRQIILPGQTATVYGGEAGLSDVNKKIVIARR